MAAVNLLTIEDATINAMMVDPRIVALLPCLNGAKQQLTGVAPGGQNCQKCQVEKDTLVTDAIRTAKSCIASARGSRLTDLKNLLNARQLRLYVRDAAGRKVAYTL